MFSASLAFNLHGLKFHMKDAHETVSQIRKMIQVD